MLEKMKKFYFLLFFSFLLSYICPNLAIIEPMSDLGLCDDIKSGTDELILFEMRFVASEAWDPFGGSRRVRLQTHTTRRESEAIQLSLV